MIYIKIILNISILIIFSNLSVLSQKKPLSSDELKKEKVYRSIKEAVYNKRRVYILNLDGQNLTEIPDKVFKLKNLQELYLRDNQLSSLPDELSALTNLQKLMLGENAIDSLPPMIGKFQQLEELDLPTHCPHGRPISKKFSYYEIEKMFKRVI